MGVETAAVSFGLAVLAWCVYVADSTLASDTADVLVGAGASRASIFRAASTLPSWYAAWSSAQVVIALAGVEQESQLLAAMMSLVSGPVAQGGFATDVYSALAGNVVMSELVTAGVPFDRPVTFVGHSMGGAVVSYMAARERQLRPARVVAVCTLGSPRAGDEALAQILVPAIKVRWEADGDIVPFVPPSVSAYAAILGLVPFLVTLQWEKFRASGRGKRLTVAGEVFPALPDDASFTNIATVIAQWLLAAPIGPFTFHGISNYALSLQLAAAAALELPDPRCLNLAALAAIVVELQTAGLDGGFAFGSDAEELLTVFADAGLAFGASVGTPAIVNAGLALAGDEISVVETSAGLAFAGQASDVPTVDAGLAIAGDVVNFEVVDAGFSLGPDIVGVKTLG